MENNKTLLQFYSLTEPLFVLDEYKAYVGTGNGKVELGDKILGASKLSYEFISTINDLKIHKYSLDLKDVVSYKFKGNFKLIYKVLKNRSKLILPNNTITKKFIKPNRSSVITIDTILNVESKKEKDDGNIEILGKSEITIVDYYATTQGWNITEGKTKFQLVAEYFLISYKLDKNYLFHDDSVTVLEFTDDEELQSSFKSSVSLKDRYEQKLKSLNIYKQ